MSVRKSISSRRKPGLKLDLRKGSDDAEDDILKPIFNTAESDDEKYSFLNTPYTQLTTATTTTNNSTNSNNNNGIEDKSNSNNDINNNNKSDNNTHSITNNDRISTNTSPLHNHSSDSDDKFLAQNPLGNNTPILKRRGKKKKREEEQLNKEKEKEEAKEDKDKGRERQGSPPKKKLKTAEPDEDFFLEEKKTKEKSHKVRKELEQVEEKRMLKEQYKAEVERLIPMLRDIVSGTC